MFFLSCCGLVITYMIMSRIKPEELGAMEYFWITLPSVLYIYCLFQHWYDLGMSWIYFLLGLVYLVTAKVTTLDNKNYIVGRFAFFVAVASFIACYANFTADRPPVGFFYK